MNLVTAYNIQIAHRYGCMYNACTILLQSLSSISTSLVSMECVLLISQSLLDTWSWNEETLSQQLAIKSMWFRVECR